MRIRGRGTPLDNGYIQDPYPRLQQWRDAEHLPRVHLSYGISALLVSGYEDARQVLESPAVSKDVRPALRMLGGSRRDAEVLSEHMLNADAPQHARLRRLAAPSVSHGRPGEWTPVIEEIVHELLDRIAARGSADLVTDFALPLPITLVCRMLGIPRADRERVIEWSNDLVVQANPESVARGTAKLGAYLTDLLERKATHPDGDGLSLLATHGPHGSSQLTRTELVSTAFLLLFAGHETMVNLIGNGVLALLEHPQQLDRLRREPGLLPGAIEELLRYDSPVSHATIRYTTAALDLRGRPLPRGRFVLVSLAGGNRDSETFADADSLDIGRAAARHLAFGHGPHYCLGAQLARVQGQLAIGALLQRFPRLRLAVEPDRLRRRQSTLMRGLESLPVRCD
jgi:cytochrome P450